MLEWQHPAFFAALLVVPLLAWWQHRRRPRFRYSSLLLVEAGRSVRRGLAWLPDVLLWAGLAVGIVALARPQLTSRETIVKSEGIDIILALDTSGSMDSSDFHIGGRRASRLDVAKAVVARFIEARPYDRIGLVVFGEEAFTQVPLTLDHDALVGFLREVDIGVAGKQSTAMGDAIAVTARRLEKVDAPSRIAILLTDGQNNSGRLTPADAATAAGALKIRFYTIGVGSKGSVAQGIFGLARRGELDEATLQDVALKTEGQYFRADDTETLAKVYETIDKLEKTTADVKEYVKREERFRPVLMVSLALLVGWVLLSSTVLRRLP